MANISLNFTTNSSRSTDGLESLFALWTVILRDPRTILGSLRLHVLTPHWLIGTCSFTDIRIGFNFWFWPLTLSACLISSSASWALPLLLVSMVTTGPIGRPKARSAEANSCPVFSQKSVGAECHLINREEKKEELKINVKQFGQYSFFFFLKKKLCPN